MDRRDWLKWAFCSAWAELAGVRSSMAQSRPSTKRNEKVVVVGAGIAGLAAARELASQGFEVLVLEGRQRTGGRIWTDRSLSTPVELGAGSIEIQRRNPLTPLARQWQIAAKPLRYESVRLYDAAGALWDEDDVEKIADRFEAVVNRERRRAKAAWTPRQSPPRSVQDVVAARGLFDSPLIDGSAPSPRLPLPLCLTWTIPSGARSLKIAPADTELAAGRRAVGATADLYVYTDGRLRHRPVTAGGGASLTVDVMDASTVTVIVVGDRPGLVLRSLDLTTTGAAR